MYNRLLVYLLYTLLGTVKLIIQIEETFLIDTFDKVLKSQDLQKLINLKKSDSNELEEHLIYLACQNNH